MKILFFLPYFLISLDLHSQEWQEYVEARENHEVFINNIRKGMDWDSILQTMDTSLLRMYGTDVQQSILFGKSPMNNYLDSFFQDICVKRYTEFPQRISGYSHDRLNKLYKNEMAQLNNTEGEFSKNLYPKFSKIISKPRTETIPLLIEYLDNHAATRLILMPFNWDDPADYLSVSDMAMELLENITWCDFYPNASSFHQFSNQPQTEQEKIKNAIQSWYRKTLGLERDEAALAFLHSINHDDHAVTFTYYNILFHGDTVTAKSGFQEYYDKMKMPCRLPLEVGKILLSLGDKRMLEDCANNIMNFRCTEDSGIKCVDLLLASGYPYVDNILAEVVATEPHSIFRNQRTGNTFVWPHILTNLGAYQKSKMPLTIMTFMNMQDELNTIEETRLIPWKKNYGDQILEGFRICDLALLKYHDTIEFVDIKDWSDKNERDAAIRTILENEKKMRQRY